MMSIRHHFLPLRPAPLHNTCLQYSILQTCVVLCLTVNPLACVQCAINNCACAVMSCHPVRSCALKRHTTSHKCRTIWSMLLSAHNDTQAPSAA